MKITSQNGYKCIESTKIWVNIIEAFQNFKSCIWYFVFFYHFVYFFRLGIQKDRWYQEERRHRQNETEIRTIDSGEKVKTAVLCWYYHELSSTTFTAHRPHWLIWQGWIIIIQYTFFTSVNYSQTVSIKSCEHFSYLLKVPEGTAQHHFRCFRIHVYVFVCKSLYWLLISSFQMGDASLSLFWMTLHSAN